MTTAERSSFRPLPLLTLPDSGSLGLSERAKALVFEDPRSRTLLERVGELAGGERPLLITGAPGTGRELIARHLHALGMRAQGPFFSVNLSAFPERSIETELFGSEKTGVGPTVSKRAGWLESAHGGTLFLDAVGDMPLETQVKFLRALQEHQFLRAGSRQPQRFDVRLVTATHVELQEAVAAGHFRGDLYRFLAATTLDVPPLRDRPGDILPLANHFLRVYQERIGIGARQFDERAVERLQQHSWPGNIRELETTVHHALLRCHGRFVSEAHLRLAPAPEAPLSGAEPRALLEQALTALFAESPPNLHDLIDEAVMRAAYQHCERNQLQTARLLGVSRNVVRARLIQYGEVAGTLRAPARDEAQSPGSRRPTRGVIRIGYQRVGLLKILRAHGSLDAALAGAGFGIRWCHYPSGIRLVEAFRSGELDVGVVGEGPPIFAHAADVPVVYVAADPPAPEAEAIIVRADAPIDSVRDLKGKKVAVLRGSGPHYLLIRALEEAGLAYGDVTTQFLFLDAAQVAFVNRGVDAWAVSDPWLAEMQESSAVRVLRDGRGLAQNSAYYLASQRFAREHAELLDVLRGELQAVARWAARDIDGVARALAPRLGLPRAALGLSLKRVLGKGLAEPELMASQQRIADAFFKLRIVPRKVSIESAQWPNASSFSK